MRFRQQVMQHILWRGVYLFSVFLLNILVSRFFKAEGSGWIYYLINNLSFILLFTGLCLESSITYFASLGRIAPEKLFALCVPWALVGALVSMLVLHFVFPIHKASVRGYGIDIAAFCYVLGLLLINYISALFFSAGNFFLPNFILFMVTMCLIVLLSLFSNNVYFRNHFVEIYFLSFFLDGFIMAICYLALHSRQRWQMPQTTQIKELLAYAMLALAANVIFFLVYRVDYWFVKRLCSVHDLGNYIQVSKLAQVFLLLPTVVAGTLFPFFTEKRKETSSLGIQIICRFFLLFFMIIASLVGIAGKWIFPFIYGPSFDKMYIPYLLLIPGIMSLSALAPLGAYFAAQAKLKVNIFSSLAAVIVIITGDILFIPRGGIIAAAIISSVGYFVNLAIVMFIFIRSEHSKLRNLLIFKRTDLLLIKNYLRQKVANLKNGA